MTPPNACKYVEQQELILLVEMLVEMKTSTATRKSMWQFLIKSNTLTIISSIHAS